MADLSPAEIMLDRLAPAQRLIRRLQNFLKDTEPPKGIPLSPKAKAARAAFRDAVQGDIAELIAQRKEIAALVKQIPDQTAQDILLMHYGLTELGQSMTYPQIELEMNYCTQTIYRYRKKGIDQLNRILKGKGLSFGETHAKNNT